MKDKLIDYLVLFCGYLFLGFSIIDGIKSDKEWFIRFAASVILFGIWRIIDLLKIKKNEE